MGSQSSDRYSQELTLWAQFLHLLISKKDLKSFLVTSAPQDKQKSSAKKKNNNMCLTACTYPSPKSHICWPSPPSSCLFGAVSQSHVRCCLPNYSPYFTPVKLNSRLSHYDFFSPQLTAFCPPQRSEGLKPCAGLPCSSCTDRTEHSFRNTLAVYLALAIPGQPSLQETLLLASPLGPSPPYPDGKKPCADSPRAPTCSPFRITLDAEQTTGAMAAWTEWGLQTLLWAVSPSPHDTHTNSMF